MIFLLGLPFVIPGLIVQAIMEAVLPSEDDLLALVAAQQG